MSEINKKQCNGRGPNVGSGEKGNDTTRNRENINESRGREKVSEPLRGRKLLV